MYLHIAQYPGPEVNSHKCRNKADAWDLLEKYPLPENSEAYLTEDKAGKNFCYFTDQLGIIRVAFKSTLTNSLKGVRTLSVKLSSTSLAALTASEQKGKAEYWPLVVRRGKVESESSEYKDFCESFV